MADIKNILLRERNIVNYPIIALLKNNSKFVFSQAKKYSKMYPFFHNRAADFSGILLVLEILALIDLF
jgi:hypothetical protein